MASDVEFRREGDKGRVAVVTINRPEVMNAYRDTTLQELEPIWDEVRDNPEIWVAILTGAGDRAFSSGHDVNWMSAVDPVVEGIRPEYYGGHLVRYIHGYGTYGFDIRKPLVAAIRGYCLGGGLMMACSCDIRIASEDARFGVPQVRIGVMSPGAAVFLPKIVGLGNAMEMLLTGEQFDAAFAYRVGLVNKVVPSADVMDEAVGWAERLCRAAPLAAQATKHAVRTALTSPVEVSLDIGHRSFAWLRTTNDGAEGPRAFKEKRSPKWTAS